jgi:hypothetical protein
LRNVLDSCVMSARPISAFHPSNKTSCAALMLLPLFTRKVTRK